MPPKSKSIPSPFNQDGSIRVDLGLEPHEFMLPAWQSKHAAPEPPHQPFDFQKASARLKKCCYPNTWIHSLHKAGIPVRMEPNEAWFWLRASLSGFYKPAKFSDKNTSKSPLPGEALAFLRKDRPALRHHEWHTSLASALIALLSPLEILEFVVETVLDREVAALSQFGGGFGNLLAGMCMVFTPRLTSLECSQLAEKHKHVIQRDPAAASQEGLAALAVLAVLAETA